MRRWRFRSGVDASRYAGKLLGDGSEVDMPHEFCGPGEDSFGALWSECLGPVTEAMGPPVQHEVPAPGARDGEQIVERVEAEVIA
jgi:hypothetical protein